MAGKLKMTVVMTIVLIISILAPMYYFFQILKASTPNMFNSHAIIDKAFQWSSSLLIFVIVVWMGVSALTSKRKRKWKH